MIKRTRRIHAGYREWIKSELNVSSNLLPKFMFQKWQYIYKKGDKMMDCAVFASWMYDGWDYEIYGVVDDVERFESLEEAEKRIEEVMGDKIKR